MPCTTLGQSLFGPSLPTTRLHLLHCRSWVLQPCRGRPAWAHARAYSASARHQVASSPADLCRKTRGNIGARPNSHQPSTFYRDCRAQGTPALHTVGKGTGCVRPHF